MPSQVPYSEPLWITRGHSPYFNEKHRAFQSHVREYFETHIIPHCAEWEAAGAIPSSVIQHYAQHGYMAASIFPLAPDQLEHIRLPGNVDYRDWDEMYDLVLMSEVARCGYLGVVFGLACGNVIGLPPVIRFGTAEQKRRFVPDVLQGRTRFCLGVTEPDAGSDVAGITTTAERRGVKYIINGTKKWITNAAWADYCTLAVRTGGPGQKGISVIIVDLRNSKGVSCRKLFNSGVSASGSTFIEFDNVEVPVENLLGRENEGFRIIMSNFNHERIWLSCTALALARVCVHDSYIYAQRRETFGKTLISNQIIRAKFATLGRGIDATEAYLEQLVHMQAASLRKTGEEPVGMGGLLASAKVLSCQLLERASREAQQVMGGIGYSKGGRGERVEQISRDVRVMVVGGGSEEILTDFALGQEAKALEMIKAKL